MWDFITGYIFGRNLNRVRKEIEYEPPVITPIEEIVELPKMTKYVAIPEITDFEATLEKSFLDYEENKLCLICKHGHKFYYTEVEAYEAQTTWGESKLQNRI